MSDVFPGGFTTSFNTLGAVKKQSSSSEGFPGVFPGGYTTGYINIGAVQKNSVTQPGYFSFLGRWFGGFGSTGSSGFQPAWASNVNIILGAGNP